MMGEDFRATDEEYEEFLREAPKMLHGYSDQ